MKGKCFRHAVMASYPRELTTDIPEHSFLDSGEIQISKIRHSTIILNAETDFHFTLCLFCAHFFFISFSDFWDERARGLGATTWVPVRMIKRVIKL